MTPAQRKYDIDLAEAMQRMSAWIAPRSRKVSDTLRLGADRLRALAYGEPGDVAPAKTLPLPPDDMRDGDLPKQPASTPASKPVRGKWPKKRASGAKTSTRKS